MDGFEARSIYMYGTLNVTEVAVPMTASVGFCRLCRRAAKQSAVPAGQQHPRSCPDPPSAAARASSLLAALLLTPCYAGPLPALAVRDLQPPRWMKKPLSAPLHAAASMLREPAINQGHVI